MNDLPTALRLADQLGAELVRTVAVDMLHHNAAAELRRLHAENEALRALPQPLAELPPLPEPAGTLVPPAMDEGKQYAHGYTADQMRDYARAALAAERDRHADALRCALEALDYCIDDSAELLNERTAQWGEYRKDRQVAMAATLERHRAVAERLRAMLMAQRQVNRARHGAKDRR